VGGTGGAAGQTGGAPGGRTTAEEPPVAPIGTVFLTFDDGPTHLTPRFLEVLADRGVPATFFVIGTSALARPDMIRRIAAEGHQIGNHTFDHHAAHLYTGDAADFVESCRIADVVLQRICGARTTVVRPPYGRRLAPDLVAGLAEAGWRVVMWNCSAADTAQPAPDAWTIFDTVTARAAALTRSGPAEVVVLMHELGGREASLEAVPFIIDHLRAKGYVFATFDRAPVRGRRGPAESPGGP
jgi:peptidoglycan/xylan/chitin deacetylase (PgdA/CDA1 family)